MQTVAVAEILAAEGLGPPGLNVLVPNAENYTALLMQPQGDIEISGTSVRNREHALADAQFGAFLRDARATDADLVVTPEYSMPWSTLTAALRAAIVPSEGKLWALGCESIRYSELEQLELDLAPVATVIFETLPAQHDRFLDPLAYIFLTHPTDGNCAAKLVMLVQFKTFPMADNDHFETNGLQCGTRIYRFGVAGQSISDEGARSTSSNVFHAIQKRFISRRSRAKFRGAKFSAIARLRRLGFVGGLGLGAHLTRRQKRRRVRVQDYAHAPISGSRD